MIVSENLPDDPKEILEEYRETSKELRELKRDPEEIRGRIKAILEHRPRLKQIEEDTYRPSISASNVTTRTY